MPSRSTIISIIFVLLLMPSVLWAQEANRELEVMEVSTPNQWSFYKYIENPVSLFAGSQDVTIDLFTVRDGVVTIPIALRYNTSGIKVSEEASWVGIGWNLNVGGYRTEIPVGGSDGSDEFFDRYVERFYSDVYPQPLMYAKYQVSPEDYNELELYRKARLDFYGKTSPDVFFYAYPGGGGKYVIDPRDGEPLHLRRTSDIKISGSRIITPEGVCHEYDKDNEFISSDENGNVSSKSMTLRRSIYPNGDEVRYNYRGKGYVDIQRSQSVSGVLYLDASGDMVKESEERRITRSGQHLSKLESILTKISTPCYDVEFYSSAREDHPVAEKLDSIVLKDKINGARLRKYVFGYSYFKPLNEDAQTNKFEEYRLRLDFVKEQSVSSEKCIGTYQFRYDETPLPSKRSYSCDFWGYANSESDITDLNDAIPNLAPLYWWKSDDETRKIVHESTQWGNVDKRHNEAYCGAGMLKEVVYPTGGSTIFEFESNTFFDKFIPSVGDPVENREQVTVLLWDDNNTTTDNPGQVFNFDSPRDFVINYQLSRGDCSWLEVKDSKIELQTGVMTEDSKSEILYNFAQDCERAFYDSDSSVEIKGSLSVRVPSGTSAVSVSLPDVIGNRKGAKLEVSIKYFDSDATEDIRVSRTSHGAGMRVKSVSHKDKDGSVLQTKRYEYNEGEESSGRLYTLPQYDRKMRSFSVVGMVTKDPFGETEVIPEAVISLREYEINSGQLGNNPYGMPDGVGYGLVRERVDGVGGYREYRFNTTALSPMESDFAQFSYVVDSPMIGKCESERIYDANGTVVESHEYKYRHIISKYYSGIRLVSAYDWHNDAISVTTPESFQLVTDSEKPYQSGCLWMYKFSLNQEEVYLERELIEKDGVRRNIDYEYDESIMLPVIKRYSQSDGCDITHHYSYLNDRVNHIITPVTEEKLKRAGLTYFSRRNDYDKKGLIREVRFVDVYGGSSVVAWRKDNSDSRGNALDVQLWETEKEKYIWDVGGRYLIEKSVMVDSVGGDWLTTQYYYDLKGDLSKITQPNGLSNYFGYDEFGRLRTKYRVVDGTLKMDESYDYKLYTDSGSAGENYMSKFEYLDLNDAREERVYLNGLSMPSQGVEADGGGDEKARVLIHEYDPALREPKGYLPYAINSNLMGYRPNAGSEQKAFYKSDYAYAETEYENDLRGRVIGKIKLGEDVRSADAKCSIEYRCNTIGEVLWLTSTMSGALKVMGHYADSTLYCTRVIDEDGKEQMTYKDMMGRVILERKLLKETSGADTNVDTYYVYDDYTNLRYVIPADVSAILEEGNTYTDDSDVVKQSFYYEYDGFGREVRSHIPCCDSETKAYDKRGLMIRYEGPREKRLSVYREYVYDGARRLLEERVVGERRAMLMHKLFYDRVMSDGLSYREGGSQMPSPDALLHNMKGLLTGEWIAIYDDTFYNVNPSYLKRAYYYDKMGQLVQKAESDVFRGCGYYSYMYDYRGNVEQEVEERVLSEANFDMKKTTERRFYRNGLVSLEGSYLLGMNGGVANAFEYDCQGNIVKKTFIYGDSSSKDYEQTNEYNLRGELVRMQSEYYEQRIEYGLGGMINGTSYNNGAYSYNYHYDSMGRLSDVLATSVDIPTERNIEYDLVGRLKYMERSSASGIDTLRYQYSGGRLYKVNDSKPYRYNGVGEMFFDGRNEYSLSYGLLGLPSSIDTGDSDEGIVYYEYLWTGEKTGSCVYYNGMRRLHLGSFIVVKNDKYYLEGVSMPGGYMMKVDGEDEMVPMLYFTDNLESVRAIVDARSGDVLKRYDYYPYGLEWGYEQKEKRREYRYKYNGKEDQANLGIDYLDYGARLYDPYIGSWTCMDPEARKFPSSGAYVFCAANPVNYIDPDGMVVRPKGDESIETIRSTLPSDARDYVKLNKDGNIDLNLLCQYGGDDYNYRCLIVLMESDYVIEVSLDEKFIYKGKDGTIGSWPLSYQSQDVTGFAGDVFFRDPNGLSTGEGGNYGKTLFPDNEGIQNSPDEKIHVYVVREMKGVGRAEALSHELYGHAYVYVISGGDHALSEHSFVGCTDVNEYLDGFILTARKTTVNNFSK